MVYRESRTIRKYEYIQSLDSNPYFKDNMTSFEAASSKGMRDDSCMACGVCKRDSAMRAGWHVQFNFVTFLRKIPPFFSFLWGLPKGADFTCFYVCTWAWRSSTVCRCLCLCPSSCCCLACTVTMWCKKIFMATVLAASAEAFVSCPNFLCQSWPQSSQNGSMSLRASTHAKQLLKEEKGTNAHTQYTLRYVSRKENAGYTELIMCAHTHTHNYSPTSILYTTVQRTWQKRTASHYNSSSVAKKHAYCWILFTEHGILRQNKGETNLLSLPLSLHPPPLPFSYIYGYIYLRKNVYTCV